MSAEEPTAMKERAEGRWTALAERLLEQALYELRSGDDAAPTTSAALAALTAGDRPEAEQDELWRELTEVDEPPCTCPPDLVERGGFRSSCPAHGSPPAACVLCQHTPCDCPAFGTDEYFALIDRRHGRTS